MSNFKDALMKVAAENPEFRTALLEELKKQAVTRYNLDGEHLTKGQMLKKVKSKEMTWEGNKPKFEVFFTPSNTGATFKVSQKDFDKLKVKDHTKDRSRDAWAKVLVKSLSMRDAVDFNTWAKGKTSEQKLDWLKKNAR